MSFENKALDEELKSFELGNSSELIDENENQINKNSTKLGQKIAYKDRKLEHKLKKYEVNIKKSENINRTTGDSQVFNITQSFKIN